MHNAEYTKSQQSSPYPLNGSTCQIMSHFQNQSIRVSMYNGGKRRKLSPSSNLVSTHYVYYYNVCISGTISSFVKFEIPWNSKYQNDLDAVTKKKDAESATPISIIYRKTISNRQSFQF